MTNFTLLYTDRPNPHNDNKPVNSIIGLRSDRRDYIYVLQLDQLPLYWKRYPKWTPSQSALVSMSNFAGVGETLTASINMLQHDNCTKLRTKGEDGKERTFLDHQIYNFMRARGIINQFHKLNNSGQIPPMHDPDVESE